MDAVKRELNEVKTAAAAPQTTQMADAAVQATVTPEIIPMQQQQQQQQLVTVVALSKTDVCNTQNLAQLAVHKLPVSKSECCSWRVQQVCHHR